MLLSSISSMTMCTTEVVLVRDVRHRRCDGRDRPRRDGRGGHQPRPRPREIVGVSRTFRFSRGDIRFKRGAERGQSACARG